MIVAGVDIGSSAAKAVIVSNGKIIAASTIPTGVDSAATAQRVMDETLKAGNLAMVDIQSTCAVFAESEIISLIHNGAKPEDILRGIFQGISGRIYPQLLEVGVNKDIVAVGGISRIQALIAALEEMAGCHIQVLDNPDITGALGAAIIGQKQGSTKS